MDFSRFDFSYAEFTNSLFLSSQLEYCNFYRAVLRGCNFSNANLKGARLDAVDIVDVNFENADCRELDIQSIQEFFYVSTLKKTKLDQPLEDFIKNRSPHLF